MMEANRTLTMQGKRNTITLSNTRNSTNTRNTTEKDSNSNTKNIKEHKHGRGAPICPSNRFDVLCTDCDTISRCLRLVAVL